jgi:hypothetical protein
MPASRNAFSLMISLCGPIGPKQFLLAKVYMKMIVAKLIYTNYINEYIGNVLWLLNFKNSAIFRQLFLLP